MRQQDAGQSWGHSSPNLSQKLPYIVPLSNHTLPVPPSRCDATHAMVRRKPRIAKRDARGWGQGGSRASPWSGASLKDLINVCRAFRRKRMRKEPTKRFMAVIIIRLCRDRERSAGQQAARQPLGNPEHPPSGPSSLLNVWMWLRSRFRYWSLFSLF